MIAATNQDLWGTVQEKKFRADLYYRLNVLPISLSPLRERKDDIPLPIEHFVQVFARRQGKSIAQSEVIENLRRYDWPGNIRELQNVIERAVIMTTGSVPTLHATAHLTQDEESAPMRTLADAERAHIASTLRETNGVVGGRRGAAAQPGLPGTSLLARMQRLGISSGALGQGARQANACSPIRVTAAQNYGTATSEPPARTQAQTQTRPHPHLSAYIGG